MATAALLSTAARRVSRSASSIVTREVTGQHTLTIAGFAPSRKFKPDWSASSQAFDAAGHGWRITYQPNGKTWSEHVSLYLEPVNNGDGRRKVAPTDPVEFTFSLLDQAGNPVPQYTRSSQGVSYFNKESMCKGFQKFIHWSELEKSGCLKDDAFTVRCDITVIKNWTENGGGGAGAGAAARVRVPPSDLHEHLGKMLWNKQCADVALEVGGETFLAHECVLAVRSPVLAAELHAATKEKAPGARRWIEIQDMEPKVFEAMLRFIYTDVLPGKMGEEGEDAVAMARGLLAAAHRYKLDRLKLMCEKTLCERIDVDTVAGTLAAAEEHGCRALKEACVEFIARPGNLKVVMETEGYEKMKASCQSIVMELFMKELVAKMN
ncbi:unnamed protein product [Urochloa decumbens]|uniref:Uncharacterized protein n=1 Tax=Urochloa decumbens TaxID=240449 RepID=A0ABC8VXQ0_9POAL